MFARHGMLSLISGVLLTMIANTTLAFAKVLPWTAKDAYHEATTEALDCFAYYVIANQCEGDGDDKLGGHDLPEKLTKAADEALRLGDLFRKIAGTSDAGLLASQDLALESEIESTSKDCVNISILIEKYSKICKTFLEDPDQEVRLRLLGPSKAWP